MNSCQPLIDNALTGAKIFFFLRSIFFDPRRITKVAGTLRCAVTKVVGTLRCAATKVVGTLRCAVTKVVGTLRYAATTLANTLRCAATKPLHPHPPACLLLILGETCERYFIHHHR
jgi:hypothetical protein